MKKIIYSTLAAVMASGLSVGVAFANPSQTGCDHGQGLANAQTHNQKTPWCGPVTPPPPPDPV